MTSKEINNERSKRPVAGELTVANENDAADVQSVMQQAADFKRSRGDNLWGEEPFTAEEVESMISNGNVYVYRREGTVAAAVILAETDARIWGEEEANDGSALYIHRLTTADAFRGQHVGGDVISLAGDMAMQSGRTKLRLDCPYENQQLCQVYENHGFTEVRREDRAPSPS